jgi:hypothetical protein
MRRLTAPLEINHEARCSYYRVYKPRGFRINLFLYWSFVLFPIIFIILVATKYLFADLGGAAVLPILYNVFVLWICWPSKDSIIVSRSLVEGGINRARSLAGEDTAKALGELAKAVAKSKNKDAGEILDQFDEELAKPAPRKGLLKRSWDNLVAILPEVTEIAGAAEAVSKLFS